MLAVICTSLARFVDLDLYVLKLNIMGGRDKNLKDSPKASAHKVDGTDNGMIEILKVLLETQKQTYTQMHEQTYASLKESHNQTFAALTQSHKAMIDSLTTQLESLRNDFHTLSCKDNDLSKENIALKKATAEAERKSDVLQIEIEKSKDETDELEISLNKPYLVVNSFKPVVGKTDEEAFINFCNDKMSDSINMTPDKIAKLYRVKRGSNSNVDPAKPETMIVKLNNEKDKEKLYKNKRKLKNSGTTFTELLPNRRKLLLNKCYELIPNHDRSIWTDNCKILVAIRNEPITHIKSIRDIETLVREKFPPHTQA